MEISIKKDINILRIERECYNHIRSGDVHRPSINQPHNDILPLPGVVGLSSGVLNISFSGSSQVNMESSISGDGQEHLNNICCVQKYPLEKGQKSIVVKVSVGNKSICLSLPHSLIIKS